MCLYVNMRVVPLKDKKGITITNAFQIVLNDSKRKPNKIWVDKGSGFHNRLMKSWLQDNNIETYSAYNEEKSVVAARFIRTLKKKIYKYMISISKTVYIGKLNIMDNKYNNTYHSAIKMKSVDVKDSTYIDHSTESNDKDPKSKVGDRVKISKYKNIYEKGYTPNWSEEVFIIKKFKNTVLWTYVISDLNVEEIIGRLYKKEWQKTNHTEFRVETLIRKKKTINCMSNVKVVIIRLLVGLIKMLLYKMSQYFPKPYERLGRNMKVELDLTDCATKADLKEATGVDTSNLAAKSDLARLKPEVDKIDEDKLKAVPTDITKLSNVVDNDVVKKAVYDKLISKVNAIDTCEFVLKTQCNNDKSNLQKKLMIGIKKYLILVKKAGCITKTTETEGKIPSITGLASTTVY